MDSIRIAAALPVLLAGLGLASCRQRPLTQPQIIATAPGGPEVALDDLRDGVRVTFDRPVAPAGALGRILNEPAFRIEPPLPGDARWLDPQTLGFFPHGPLRRSTGYQIALAPGLPLAPGLRAPDWNGIRIVYARLTIEQVSFQGWREHQTPRPVVTIRASQPLSPETAAAACGFVEKTSDGEGRRAPAMIAGAHPRPDGGTPEERDQDLAASLASGRAVRLEPTEPLASGQSYVVRCGPGLRPRDGGEGLVKAHDEPFTTYGPAAIKTIEPHGRDIAADSVPIKIEFATPMDPGEVRRRVQLRSPQGPVGALDLAANYRRTVFTWSGNLQPRRQLPLVIPKGLTDAFGQAIEKERRHDFRVGDASPRLEAETGIYTVERASGRYPMWTRNLSRVEIRCASVPEARLAAVLTGPANYDAWWDAAARGSVEWKQLGLARRTTELQPDAARNRWHDQTLDLAATCGAPGTEPGSAGGAGVYLMELITGEERNREGQAARRERRSLVNVTDLGLLAKVGNSSSLVWVVRLSTGAPVAGAAVAIRDLKGRVRFSGTSNADGVVQAPGAAKLTGKQPEGAPAVDGEEGEWEDHRARRVVVSARAGDDLAVLDTNWNNGIQNWNFGVNEDRRVKQQRLRGFLHSDRGLYRPGDTVHLRGLVRALDRMGAMSVPRAGKVHLVIEDPRGATIEESDLPLSAFGGFHRDLALPAEARLGDWRARATLAGTTITERFSVEEYRARTFEVKVKTGKRHAFVNQPLAFEVEANFLYGAPLASGKLDWSVRRRRYLPRFEGWDEYTFQDFAKLADEGLWWARDEERSFSDGVADGQVTLDPAGRAKIDTRDVAPGDGPQDYLFEATVTDASGQAVTSGTALTAHAADLYLGVHPAEMVQAAEMPFAVQLVAFNPAGKRRAASAELTLTRRQYDCGLGKSASGDAEDWGCRRKDDPKPAVRKTVSVPASGTAAVERVVLAEPGEYVVEVSARHGRGGRSVASEMIYVVGKGEAFWSGDEGERMTLIASKPRFRPGDTARLVPQTQLGQALALVTLERDGVLSHRLQPMGSSGEAIEIPIDRTLAPNIFASVVMVRGRSGAGDGGRPRFKMGMVNLEVDASQRRLQVSVTPERPAYRPGDTVRATVKVISEGAPVRAELAVAAADEGVLQILGYRTPDPLPAFYAPWALGVDSATTWNRLLRAKNPSKVSEDDQEEGGDGGGDEAGRVRSRFVATAFWNPAVVTGADGTAQVSFAAPDNLTAFRLMAVAADKGDRFGSGEARFTINKPLQVVPALPRFLSLGDQAQAAVTLHNNEAAAARVEVVLSASGVELTGPASQSVDVPPRSNRQAVFAVRATRAGKAAFTFKATGGGHSDAVVLEIPVVQAVVRSSELVAEGATSGRIEAPLPAAKGVLVDRSELEVVLDRTGLGRVSEGFGYLIEYPYGCLEQTTSKVVPLVALGELMGAGALGGGEQKGAEERIRGFVKAGIAKILRHQNDDGGFGLWIGAGSELHYTAYALWGLEIARRGGHASEARATEEGVRYLKARLQAKPPTGSSPLELAGETGTRAFVHHVLAELGQGDPGALGALFERRRELPVYGRAFLLRALVKTERNEQAVALAGELLALIPGSTGPVVLKEGAGLDWYWSSDVRTTALVLLGLLEGGAAVTGNPAHAAVARLTQGLLGARSEGRWSSTQENVYGLTALAALARARGGGPPVRVTIGGVAGQGRTVTLAGTAIERLRMPLPPAGSGPLVISAAGGEIFYAARLHLQRPVSPQALDAGIAIRREYLDPASGATLSKLKLGQAVKVRLTVVSPTRLAHVAVVDHLPAGLEPVITRFRRTGIDGPGDEEDRPVWWGPSWKTSWQHQELRDDRALVFADVLAAGESRHEYLVRATTAGRFLLPPATTEAMYRPELHGRSTGGTLVVER